MCAAANDQPASSFISTLLGKCLISFLLALPQLPVCLPPSDHFSLHRDIAASGSDPSKQKCCDIALDNLLWSHQMSQKSRCHAAYNCDCP